MRVYVCVCVRVALITRIRSCSSKQILELSQISNLIEWTRLCCVSARVGRVSTARYTPSPSAVGEITRGMEEDSRAEVISR